MLILSSTIKYDCDFPILLLPMPFSVVPRPPRTVVIEIGETLDFHNASDFKILCREQVEAGYQNFILDFSRTDLLDSTGLGAIFSLYRRISPNDGRVVFAGASRPVQVVVQLTRTYKVFRQFPSVEAAHGALED